MHSTSGQILAKNRIDVSAEEVTFDTAHNIGNSQSHSSDLKVGQFARVSSPIIDLIQTVEQAVNNKDASDRVKAAQALGAAAKAYSTAANLANGGALFRVETGSGFSHSRERNETSSRESVGNQLNAQHINITSRSGDITATHTAFTSKDAQGNRLKDSTITFDSAKDLNLNAGQSEYQMQGKQQSSGVEIGTGVAVGAQTGFSNGKQSEHHLTHQNSQIDTETLNINTQGNATLKGATAKANRINAEIKGDLTIESLQDIHQSESNSAGFGGRLQGAIGSAWGGSAYGNLASGEANRKQVTQQSGLFAEEGGYHINANNVDLVASVIASTNSENSELTTNNLTFRDIENYSSSEALSAGVSASVNLNKAAGTEAKTEAQAEQQAQTAKLTGTPQSNGISPSIPMFDSSGDRSTTKATLTEGKITLNKDSNPTQTTAQALGINTDLSQANQEVAGLKDINQTLREQQILSQAAGNMLGAVSTYAEQKAKETEEEIKQAEAALQAAEKEGNSAKIREKQTAYAAAQAEKSHWEDGGKYKRRMDAAVMAITAVLSGGSAGQTAVTVLSPELNAQIHELTKDSKTANLLAHAALSALEAKASGTSATAGAIAGVAGEATAMLLSEAVFNKQQNELTAEEKNLLKVAGQLAGAVAGQASGSSTADTVMGAETAKRAVENNYLSKQDWIDYRREIAACGDNQECIKGVKDEFSDVNRANSENLKAACRLGGSSEACSEHTKAAQEGFDYARANIQFDNSGWMASMMNANKREAKIEPSQALVGHETITNIESALTDPNVRNRLENDPTLREALEKGIDQAASAVRTEKTNAYEFSAKLEYPNISVLSNDYKVFGRELGAEPVVPEYYVYSGLGLTKIGKNLFDLSSPSTRLIVGANGAVSAGSQYLTNGEVSVKETLKDMGEAYITKDFSFKGYTAWNIGTGFLEGGLENTKWQDGKLQGFSVENALERVGAKTVTSTIGYGFGKGIENTLGKNINTYGNSLRTEPIRAGSPITRFVEPSSVPVGVGNAIDSISNKFSENEYEKFKLLNGVEK